MDERRRRAAVIFSAVCSAACLALACSGGSSTAASDTASTSTSAASSTTATDSASTTSAGTSTGATSTGATSTGATSTGATSTGATSTTSTATETGCSFIGCDTSDSGCDAAPGLDGVVRCTLECDVWLQDCPEGAKCTPWANDGGPAYNASRCVPVDAEPQAPGEPCVVTGDLYSGVDSCALGALCWDVDEETHEGVCVALCAGSPDNPSCAEAGTFCVIENDGALTLCLPSCHPLEQGCADGQVCAETGDFFACVPDVSGDGGAFADPCDAVGSCDSGLTCVAAEHVDGCAADGCCSPFCDTTSPNTCPGDGQECILWYELGQAPPGYENVGLCGIP